MKRRCYWLLALLPVTGFADDAELTGLLARIRQNGAAQFHYQETRTLELTTSPWQGQGYMLSGADGSLVKLQLKPKRIIMAISTDRLYYWDPEENQRHTAGLGQAGPAAGQIEVFRNILQGRTEALKASYDFSSEVHDKSWTLRLTPKPDVGEENTPSIEISGDEDDNKRRMLIRQADGESSEYRMVRTAEGQEPVYSIQNLLLEAIGN